MTPPFSNLLDIRSDANEISSYLLRGAGRSFDWNFKLSPLGTEIGKQLLAFVYETRFWSCDRSHK
jgi:hypothetical protein